MEKLSGLQRGASLVAATLVAFSLVNVATTFLPGAPVFGMGPTLVGFVLVLPLFAGALLWLGLGRGRGRWSRAWRQGGNEELQRQWRTLSRALRTALHTLVLVLWLCALSGILLGRGGQPYEEDGRYYLNDHGTETDITKEEYEDALQHDVRAFASGTGIFMLVAAGVLRYFRPGLPPAEIPPDDG